MIFNIGYLLLIIAMLLTLFGMVGGFYGGFKRRQDLVAVSFHAIYAVGALVTAASIILWYGLLNDHFELSYVWNHSERALPVFYKFASLWGGQAGSLLFWCLLLSVYGVTVAFSYRNRHRVLMPFVNAVLLGTSFFFLILLVFAANPFEQYGFSPPDGLGLNPLLQNYWMVIHPVMLYLGYVGLVVPFAFGIGALISKQVDNRWVRVVRRWTLIPWMFLSVGILMGSQWAYMELGWGGYWAWDPVENASFLPWLTATAFLHSILIQDRRGMLKVWNMVLIWATYFLVILGTFTTRSGILESVHSFARSDVGPYFLVFLSILAVGFVWLLFERLPLLRSENEVDSMMSREAAFLANNWLFVSITFATLWGTFFPMFSELITDMRISVAAPWFNKVTGPLFLLLFFLMGVGPLLGWRRTSIEQLRSQFTLPLLAAVIFAAIFSYFSPRVYPVIGLSLCVMILATIVQEYARGISARHTATGEALPIATLALIQRNGQRYGGYIVHLGIVMMGVAIIGNNFYQQETNATLAVGESTELAGYTFVYNGLEASRQSNLTEYAATLVTFNSESGAPVGTVVAKRNIYDKTPDQPTSEVGLHMRADVDIYVVLNGWDANSATFTISINPLTLWLWIGGMMLVLGTVMAIWPAPKRKEATVRAPAGRTAGSVA